MTSDRGETLRRGEDVALIAIGKAVPAALGAAERLEEEGFSAEVIDARFVKPLDVLRISDAARRCQRVVTVEDHVARGGFGSAVLELLCLEVPEASVRVLGHPDHFVEHADAEAQWRAAGIDAESIAEHAATWIREEK